MTPEEFRSIMAYLKDRVHLGPKKAENPVAITFHAPMEEEMIDAGLNTEGVKRILCVSWWEEMVADIVETPDYCDSDDSPEQILEYARDVVSDYIHKRFSLNGE
ncbi:MAG: hypothetical protein JRJ65_11780 [Deltaproteobacteria bacterium]|nr:hypothetical protein [Deltaproteobacteria bacterium]